METIDDRRKRALYRNLTVYQEYNQLQVEDQIKLAKQAYANEEISKLSTEEIFDLAEKHMRFNPKKYKDRRQRNSEARNRVKTWLQSKYTPKDIEYTSSKSVHCILFFHSGSDSQSDRIDRFMRDLKRKFIHVGYIIYRCQLKTKIHVGVARAAIARFMVYLYSECGDKNIITSDDRRYLTWNFNPEKVNHGPYVLSDSKTLYTSTFWRKDSEQKSERVSGELLSVAPTKIRKKGIDRTNIAMHIDNIFNFVEKPPMFVRANNYIEGKSPTHAPDYPNIILSIASTRQKYKTVKHYDIKNPAQILFGKLSTFIDTYLYGINLEEYFPNMGCASFAMLFEDYAFIRLADANGTFIGSYKYLVRDTIQSIDTIARVKADTKKYHDRFNKCLLAAINATTNCKTGATRGGEDWYNLKITKDVTIKMEKSTKGNFEAHRLTCQKTYPTLRADKLNPFPGLESLEGLRADPGFIKMVATETPKAIESPRSSVRPPSRPKSKTPSTRPKSSSSIPEYVKFGEYRFTFLQREPPLTRAEYKGLPYWIDKDNSVVLTKVGIKTWYITDLDGSYLFICLSQVSNPLKIRKKWNQVKIIRGQKAAYPVDLKVEKDNERMDFSDQL